MPAVANELRALRKARGWVVQELSLASDVSPSMIQAIELYGRFLQTAEKRQRLAEALGVREADIWPHLNGARVNLC